MSDTGLHQSLQAALAQGDGTRVLPRVAFHRRRAAGLAKMRPAIVVAMLLAASVFVIHRVNQRSRVGFHGLTHSAITFSVLDGNIPPSTPFAVDLPLPYYWSYHVLLAGIVRVLDCPPVAAAEIVNTVVLGALTVLLAWMGRWLLGSVWGGLLALFVVLFAMNPFGPLLLAYRVFDGSVGLSIWEFTRSPTHPMLRGMFPYFDLRWIGAYFFHVQCSSRPLALFSGVVTAMLVCRSFAHVSLLRGAMIVLATAMACAMQPIVGVGTAFGLGTGLLFVRFTGRRRELLPNGVLAGLFACMGAGVLLAYPTYRQLLNGDLVGLPVEGSFAALAEKGFYVFGMLAIAPLTLTWLAWRRGLLTRPQLQMLAVGGVTLVATSWITYVPGHREHSFFNIGMYLLALPAAAACGWGLAERPGAGQPKRRELAKCQSRRVVAWILPAACIMLASFVYRQPIALASDGMLLRYPGRADAMAVYDWIARNTPSDALIMFDTRDGEQIGFYCTESEIPAMTKRFLFIDVVAWFIPQNHPVVAAREEIVAAIFDGKPLTTHQSQMVHALKRPLYALARAPDEDATLAANFGTCRFREGKYAVYAIHEVDGTD